MVEIRKSHEQRANIRPWHLDRELIALKSFVIVALNRRKR